VPKIVPRIVRRLAATLRLARLAGQDNRSFQIIQQVRRSGLSFLGPAALLDLFDTARSLEKRQVPGLFVETGTALGGSALVIATAKQRQRKLLLYDVFGLIPPPTSRDGAVAQERYAEISTGSAAGSAGALYYGYHDNLLEEVRGNFQRFGFEPETENIWLIQGLYEETLTLDEPVAFAHIDCDWYESVMTCLERIVPHLSPGGVLVIDDYLQWPGCKQAVDEYFAPQRANFRFIMRARLHIERR
jgi:asparagine synthase (glutamine-hydrolysing)